VKIAGIQLRTLSRAETMTTLAGLLRAGQGSHVVTINPEMVVHATQDTLYKTILHSADVHVVDGVGVQLVARLQGFKIDRFTGVDLVDKLSGLAKEEDARVFFLGTGDSVVLMQAAKNLQKRYPGLKIAGTHPGIRLVEKPYGVIPDNETEHQAMLARIRETNPAVVFVAFGHGKQEKWIWQYKKMLPDARIFVGVGGALDFIAGRVRRAPVWMQKAGLEWLWRLFCQPWRLSRVFNATAVFLWKVMRGR